MRISDWSSDVCSSDLFLRPHRASFRLVGIEQARFLHNLPTRFQHIDLPVCFIFDGLHDEANGVHVLCLGARSERIAGLALRPVDVSAHGALDRKSNRLTSSHYCQSRLTSSACKKKAPMACNIYT